MRKKKRLSPKKMPRNQFLKGSTSGFMSLEGKQVRGCQ